MKTKNFTVFLTLFLLVMVSSSSVPALAFSQNPQLTDESGDTPYNYQDMKNIWVDNNATYLMFKVELAAPFNGTLGQVIYMAILVDDNTAVATGFFDTWKCNFAFGVSGDGAILKVVFYDYPNGSNDLWSNNHLGYYIQSNGNKTIEIGYKLQTYQDGKGFLDVALGQTIEVRFYVGGDSDVAPENEELPLTYTLGNEEGSNWLTILLILLFPAIGVALGLFILYRRRREL